MPRHQNDHHHNRAKNTSVTQNRDHIDHLCNHRRNQSQSQNTGIGQQIGNVADQSVQTAQPLEQSLEGIADAVAAQNQNQSASCNRHRQADLSVDQQSQKSCKQYPVGQDGAKRLSRLSVLAQNIKPNRHTCDQVNAAHGQGKNKKLQRSVQGIEPKPTPKDTPSLRIHGNAQQISHQSHRQVSEPSAEQHAHEHGGKSAISEHAEHPLCGFLRLEQCRAAKTAQHKKQTVANVGKH